MIEDNQKETNKSEKDQSKDEKSKLEIKKEIQRTKLNTIDTID